MRHLPFLQALGKANGQDDLLWRSITPGYLILRVLDQWLEDRPAIIAGDPEILALKKRIRNVSVLAPELRHTLLQLLDALTTSPDSKQSSVFEHLFEYGNHLYASGQFSLARHIYETTAEALKRTEVTDSPWMSRAYLRYGLMCRQLGDFDGARISYARVELLALQENDARLLFTARTGNANILRVQGNFPAAEEIFAAILDEAVARGMRDWESAARHSQGSILHACGRYNEAMENMYHAYELSSEEWKEQILSDIAACQMEMGYHEAARDTQQLLVTTAKSPIARASALVNLIELAVFDDDKQSFDQRRRDFTAYMQQQQIPVEHKAHANFYVAKGIERFYDIGSALQAYRTVAADAHSAQIHQIELQVAKKLADLGA